MYKSLIAKKLEIENEDLALPMQNVLSSNALINCQCFHLRLLFAI